MELLNEAEIEMLKKTACKYPILYQHIPFLRVKRREFTGVGMYIYFDYTEINDSLSDFEPKNGVFGDDCILLIPNLRYGLCYVIGVSDGKITLLELVTFGHETEKWDGSISKFSFNCF